MGVPIHYNARQVDLTLQRIIAPDLHSAEQVAFWFVNIYENPILTRDKVLDMIVYLKSSEDCTEGLETKVGLRADLVELLFDNLIMGSRLCAWSPTVELYVLLNSGVEAALMCLDSLRHPSCVQIHHIGSSVGSTVAHAVEVLGMEFLDQIFSRRACVFV
ncbi:hypothetical protein M9H77_03037 [Catharanthus roseus]|uniref:Uncharacterized protein n=1 Tax=Catharanthus roseus TaxID=4058 RepID=A0ACC0CAJ9_CATRO|nr:hypothetical protein M9H77_03037 [Catharanthus roseus]